MEHKTTTIPKSDSQEMTCPSCQAKDRYHMIPDQFPHLYCIRCHNAYVELEEHPKLKNIDTNWGARKVMHEIEGGAPLCACSGMFMFNVAVHCTHCGEILPLPLPNAKEDHARLVYDKLIIFDGTIVRYDNGVQELFRLES